MPRRSIVLAIVLATLAPALPAAEAVSPLLFPGEPFVDFTWLPEEPRREDEVTFTSLASSQGPAILLYEWEIETPNGTVHALGTTTSVTFGRAGAYLVTHKVTDATLATRSVTRTVVVANTPPAANFSADPAPAFRGVPVTFRDASTDADGDAIVNWTWDLGDGSLAFGRNVTRTYGSLGTYSIWLTVRDAAGAEASAMRPLRVLNRPPTVLADMSPTAPQVGETVTFSAEGIDPDVPGGGLAFQWSFSDNVTAQGPLLERVFGAKGNYTAVVRATDADGGVSAPFVMAFHVDGARPTAAFTYSPSAPVRGSPVEFLDASVGNGAPIVAWHWDFGDNATSNVASPTHAYARNGTFLVTLEIRDADGLGAIAQRPVHVNIAPEARFASPPGRVGIDELVTFSDLSVDEDGVIVNWTWSYGDGAFSFARDGSHAYSAPGVYLVDLTVRDDDGAVASVSRFVEVANAPPVALWTFATPAQERNVPFHFDGTTSFDPDGHAIDAYAWSFGDGTPTASGPTPTHTFGRSGFYTVGLSVSDGFRWSARTAESHQRIRVGADHDVLVHVTATRPDGSLVDLSRGPYTVTAFIHGNVIVPPEHIGANGTAYDVVLPRDMWVHGSVARVRIAYPGGMTDTLVALRDDVRFIELPVVIQLAAVTTVAIQGDAAPLEDGSAVYAAPFATPHGAGTLRWADGAPVSFGAVQIEARYLGVRAATGVREEAGTLDGGVAGWCRVDLAASAADGTFAWAFDGVSTCATNGIDGAPLAPGRWELRARPLDLDGTYSATRGFVADATGGIAAVALSGLM